MANYHTADPYGPTVADRGTAEASHRWHVMAHHCLPLHPEVANLIFLESSHQELSNNIWVCYVYMKW